MSFRLVFNSHLPINSFHFVVCPTPLSLSIITIHMHTFTYIRHLHIVEFCSLVSLLSHLCGLFPYPARIHSFRRTFTVFWLARTSLYSNHGLQIYTRYLYRSITPELAESQFNLAPRRTDGQLRAVRVSYRSKISPAS